MDWEKGEETGEEKEKEKGGGKGEETGEEKELGWESRERFGILKR
jgi:hypothetical protein